jgi:hypothetical protein
VRRAIAASAVALAFGLGLAVPAGAADATPTRLTVRADATTVDGEPVMVHASLTDAAGHPVAGALLRLVVPVEFMGATRNEIVGEGTTDERGRASIPFAPAQAGAVTATVSFWGTDRYAPSDAPLAFDVVRPVIVYRPQPVGLQAPWARARLILVPFLGVWLTYAVVLGFLVRLRRAGEAAGHLARAGER